MANKSTLKRKRVEAELIEFLCTECENGVHRVNPSKNFDGQMWSHICTHCHNECLIAKPYPLIVYKGENFILDKHVVRHLPKPNVLTR